MSTDPNAENTTQMPAYSPAQIQAFFERLRLPAEHRHASIHKAPLAGDADAQLAFLSVLLKYTLVYVPFENLALHYSPWHAIDISPDVLFRKVVGDADGTRVAKSRRGGYCMENNSLFGAVLRGLGFEVRSVGARVWEGDGWTGLTHMVNLVTIAGKTAYLVDTGFGSNGAITPLPLPPKDSTSWPAQPHISPAQSRLVWRDPAYYTNEAASAASAKSSTALTPADLSHWDPSHPLPSPNAWIHETQLAANPVVDAVVEANDASGKPATAQQDAAPPWTPVYSFLEAPFFPRDYVVVNLFTSTSRQTWFTYMVVAMRMVCAGELRAGSPLCNGALRAAWLANKEGAGGASNGVGTGKGEVGAEERDDDIVGQLILLNDGLKLRVHGASTNLVPGGGKLQTEGERIKALEEHYGIFLSDEEKRGTFMMVTSLKRD